MGKSSVACYSRLGLGSSIVILADGQWYLPRYSHECFACPTRIKDSEL